LGVLIDRTSRPYFVKVDRLGVYGVGYTDQHRLAH